MKLKILYFVVPFILSVTAFVLQVSEWQKIKKEGISVKSKTKLEKGFDRRWHGTVTFQTHSNFIITDNFLVSSEESYHKYFENAEVKYLKEEPNKYMFVHKINSFPFWWKFINAFFISPIFFGFFFLYLITKAKAYLKQRKQQDKYKAVSQK